MSTYCAYTKWLPHIYGQTASYFGGIQEKDFLLFEGAIIIYGIHVYICLVLDITNSFAMETASILPK